VLLTPFDRRPPGPRQPDRTAISSYRHSYRQMSRQSIESPGMSRDPAGEDLADH
jgi:hypothetical protein